MLSLEISYIVDLETIGYRKKNIIMPQKESEEF